MYGKHLPILLLMGIQYTTIRLYHNLPKHFPLIGHLESYQIFSTTNKVVNISRCKYLLHGLFPWEIFLEVKLLGQRICAFLRINTLHCFNQQRIRMHVSPRPKMCC